MSLETLLAALEADSNSAKGPQIQVWTNRPSEQRDSVSPYNQIGGHPLGITEENWPRMDLEELRMVVEEMGNEFVEGEDNRMEFVFSADLRPLGLFGLPEEAVAVAVFLSNIEYHSAWEPDTEHAKVVFLTEEDMQRGVYTGALPKRTEKDEAEFFSWVGVEVPAYVLDQDSEEPSEKPIRDAVWNLPLKSLPTPLWLQDDEMGGDDYYEEGEGEDEEGEEEVLPQFLFQFSEEFADVNLGDMGEMYVYNTTAFFQCY